jgi:hypothetical protein
MRKKKYVKWTPKLKREEFFVERRKCKLTYGGWSGGYFFFCYEAYTNKKGDVMYLLQGTKPPRGWTKGGGSTNSMYQPSLPLDAVGVKFSYVPLKGAKVDKNDLFVTKLKAKQAKKARTHQ